MDSVSNTVRIIREQADAAQQLADPSLVTDYARINGCTEKQARDGARQSVYDWVMEEILERMAYGA